MAPLRPSPLTTLVALAALPLLLALLAGCSSPGGGDGAGDGGTEPTAPRVGHEHSVFRMFAGNEEVSFDHPRFDYSTTLYGPAHLHLGGPESTAAQYVLHKEGLLGTGLETFFATLNVTLSPGGVALDGEVHGGRRIDNTDAEGWQLWVDACGDGEGNWFRPQQLGAYVPQQHDRMLIAYAPWNADAASLSPLTAQVPTEAQLEGEIGDRCPADPELG